MKRLRGLLVLATIISAFVPLSCWAQYMGTFSQQTVSQTFTVTMGATPSFQNVQNLGQAAHTILVSGTAAQSSDCVVSLDGSQTGSGYVVIGSVLMGSSAEFDGVTVNGYFPLLQLAFNLESSAACDGKQAVVNYIGYQFPVPNSYNLYPLPVQNAVAAVTPVITSGLTAPWRIFSISCSNPAASSAYVQIFDAKPTPVLGTSELFEFQVPANGTVDYSPPVALGGWDQAWLGASTTPGGSTAVGTSVVCSAEYTNDAPMWPLTPPIAVPHF